MTKITILLVDDHRLIRDSWSFILNSDPRFKVIGETSSTEEAINIVTAHDPDVILMDVNMAPVNGFDATKQVLNISPESKVIAVSMHTLPAYAKRMLQIGAMGYVTKNSSKEEMMTAIIEVNAGRKYICEEVRAILAHQDESHDPGVEPDMNNLSRREIDIIKFIREGFSSKEISYQLDISLKTVEVHRYNILKKLKIKNTAALVNFINMKGL